MKKNVTIALTAFLMFAGTSNLNAQQDSTAAKLSFGNWLTKTPWIVGFGADIISDNQGKGKIIQNPFNYTYYPAKFSAEKTIKKGWSGQFVFASTSLHPFNYACVDLNAKYDFNNLIGDTKWFDPFGVIGLGYSYRNHNPGAIQQNLYKITSGHSANLNLGLGANFWLYPNMGITTQGLLKQDFGKDSYLQASIGLVFKIGNCAATKCEATPKTQEAQDALQHLRGIINK